MAWLTWVFLALSGLTGLATFLFLKKQQAIEKGGFAGGFASIKSIISPSRGNLKDFWDVQDVKKGIITMAPGGRYRLILRLMAQDFFLLSEEEQNGTEDNLAAALLGLDFPVQTLITSEALDTRQAVAVLREEALHLSEQVKAHALERANYLEAMRQSRAVTARSAYLVVQFDTVKGFKYAHAELMAQASSLADALSSAKAIVELLDTGGVCDLLAHLLNRGRVWRPSEAGEYGVMSLYHISERQVKQDDLSEAI